MDGLPIVASSKDLFIGMSLRKDGGLGGLWRWNGHGYDPAADPQKPGRILLSTAPAAWENDARKGQMPTRFFERKDQQSDRR